MFIYFDFLLMTHSYLSNAKQFARLNLQLNNIIVNKFSDLILSRLTIKPSFKKVEPIPLCFKEVLLLQFLKS